MEGYLKKYTNILQRWQERYFILNNEILLYCDKKCGPTKGQIHLKVAAIIMVLEDPLRFIINTGTTEIHLRASTVAEKINWVNALKKAQEICLSVDQNYLVNQDSSPIDGIQNCLGEIWSIQAQFDETLSILTPKLERNSQIRELATKMENLGRLLKNKVTLCTQMLDEEKRRLQSNVNIQGQKQLNHNVQEQYDYSNEFPASEFLIGNGNGYYQEIENLNGNEQFQQNRVESDTIFQSFADLDIQQGMSSQQENQIQISVTSILEEIRNIQPIKYLFQKMMVTNAKYRDRLLRTKDPKEKLNIFALIRDLIGKDLSKFSVPVFLNEPLSMLQRLTEQLEYHQLLLQSNKERDSCLRMCYIIGFALSPYAASIHRTKKPFNPLLGETYELIHQDYKFVSEQVSHHPPISACFADGPEFQFWATSDIKSKFTGRSMEVRPLGSSHVLLKKFKEHYTFKNCVTYVKNILIGELYIEQVGDMTFINHTNGDTGILNFQERGWNNKGIYELNGSVKNSNGIEKFLLKGRYDQQLIAFDIDNKKEIVIWTNKQLPQNSNMYYNFTEFAIQLNHLNADMIKNLPCSDSRLRPDQLALEMGMTEFASKEKSRIEEKQRARRKQMQSDGQVHVPRYFAEKQDELTQETIYVYLNNYWQAKHDHVEALDIF